MLGAARSCEHYKVQLELRAGACPTPPSPVPNVAGAGPRKLAHWNSPHCPLEKCNDVHHVPYRRLPICSLHEHSDAYKWSQAAWPWERAVFLRKAPQWRTTPAAYKSAICPRHGDHRFPVLGVENRLCCVL